MITKTYTYSKTLIFFIIVTLPIEVSADLWSDLDSLATTTFESVVGFPFASTSSTTKLFLEATYAFPIGFLGNESNVLISYAIILLAVFFAFRVFTFIRT